MLICGPIFQNKMGYIQCLALQSVDEKQSQLLFSIVSSNRN